MCHQNKWNLIYNNPPSVGALQIGIYSCQVTIQAGTEKCAAKSIVVTGWTTLFFVHLRSINYFSWFNLFFHSTDHVPLQLTYHASFTAETAIYSFNILFLGHIFYLPIRQNLDFSHINLLFFWPCRTSSVLGEANSQYLCKATRGPPLWVQDEQCNLYKNMLVQKWPNAYHGRQL